MKHKVRQYTMDYEANAERAERITDGKAFIGPARYAELRRLLYVANEKTKAWGGTAEAVKWAKLKNDVLAEIKARRKQ